MRSLQHSRTRSFSSIWSSRASNFDEFGYNNSYDDDVGGDDSISTMTGPTVPDAVEPICPAPSFGYCVDGSVHALERPTEETECRGHTRVIKNVRNWIQSEPLLMVVFSTLVAALISGVVIVCGLAAASRLVLRMQGGGNGGSLVSAGGSILSTSAPSAMPSASPSSLPSTSPTSRPSASPSSKPSLEPTSSPSIAPSSMPTQQPSFSPSQAPTSLPSLQPSSTPSHGPSRSPTSMPSNLPSTYPSTTPSSPPSSGPSAMPSSSPSSRPSTRPSSSPTSMPSVSPTALPSWAPSAPPSSSPTDTPIIFYAMGDVPYSPEETEDLKSQVAEIPSDAQFVVHVGDITKVSETNCTSSVYTTVRSILSKSKSPVFILPGDNDINDCPSPPVASFLWRQSFGSFEDNWAHSFLVERQNNRYENFAFVHHNVLFLGVDVIESGSYAAIERSVELENDLEWALGRISRYENDIVGLVIFSHAASSSRFRPFFRPLAKKVKKLRIPCLCLHGNGHKWEYEEKAFGVRNIIRVQVDRGGIAAPLRVRFRADASEPFQFDRRE